MSRLNTHTNLCRASWIAAAAGTICAAILASGCGQSKLAVCAGSPQHIVIVPSTSKTDYDVSVELTPTVSRQVIGRVAQSCGRLTVGIQDGRPEANLELHTTRLEPEDKAAYNPGAKTDVLIHQGIEFTQANLIRPLDARKPTGGSPFFSTLAKVGEELKVHGWALATIVLIGDGLVVERPPGGGEMIRLGVDPTPRRSLAKFTSLLSPLKGSCVMLVGAGATSKLSDQSLRTSQQIFGKTLEGAGVSFVSTRSPDLPHSC